MNKKLYFSLIGLIQEFLLILSILMMCILPIFISFHPEFFTQTFYSILFTISLAAVFFVMTIRPIADIVNKVWFIRPLVILRKGFGVLSASIIVSFVFSKMITSSGNYLLGYFTPAFWSTENYVFLAHIGDVTGMILLVTSNLFSKRVLGRWWKRIQKLAYVYFYSGALYEVLKFHSTFAVFAIIVVTVLSTVAWSINNQKEKSI